MAFSADRNMDQKRYAMILRSADGVLPFEMYVRVDARDPAHPHHFEHSQPSSI